MAKRKNIKAQEEQINTESIIVTDSNNVETNEKKENVTLEQNIEEKSFDEIINENKDVLINLKNNEVKHPKEDKHEDLKSEIDNKKIDDKKQKLQFFGYKWNGMEFE